MSERADLVRGWLAKADNDLLAGQHLLSAGPYDIVCFHAQQAIEKLLKGLLAFYDQPPPRTHDLEEVTARAHKRLLALQLQDVMNESQLTKTELAERMQTSRSQLDRLLDPENTSITLESLERLAHAVGKRLVVKLA